MPIVPTHHQQLLISCFSFRLCFSCRNRVHSVSCIAFDTKAFISFNHYFSLALLWNKLRIVPLYKDTVKMITQCFNVKNAQKN